MLSIIERGLIPPSSKISFEPLPIAAKQIKPNETTTIQKLNEKFKETPVNKSEPFYVTHVTHASCLHHLFVLILLDVMYKMDPNYRSSDNFKEAELISRQEEKKVLRSREYMKRRNEAQKLLAMLNETSDGTNKRSDATNVLAIMDKDQNKYIA